MQVVKKIAGISFSANGIVVERPFVVNPPQRLLKEEYFTGKFLDQAKRIVKYRMAHCYRQLHSNLTRATHITEYEIAWPSGHFSVPVWEELEKALEITDVRQLNALQTQQIIRTLLLGICGSWLYDHNTETWEKLKDGDIQLTDDFRLFITEHMLCMTMQAEANQ